MERRKSRGERKVDRVKQLEIDAEAENRAVDAFKQGRIGEGGGECEKSLKWPIFAIDPGTTESGWVWYEAGRVRKSGVSSNHDLLADIQAGAIDVCELAIEMIASYGMAVGREVFETCVWIGRFKQAFRAPESVRLVYRKDVKMHICGTPRAKDANIRQALIDKLGPAGTKKAPGPTYGVKSHAWAALGVAVTAAETKEDLV